MTHTQPAAAVTGPADPGRPSILLRPLIGHHLWRTFAFCLVAFGFGIFGLVWVLVTISLGAGLLITLLGVIELAAGLSVARNAGGAIRRIARPLLVMDVADPEPFVAEPGFFGWVKGNLLDPVAWRAMLYLFLLFPIGVFGFVVCLVLWPLTFVLGPLVFVTPYVLRALRATHEWLVRELLGPVRPSERVRRLRQSRDQAVDTAAADLRRIERDLHDGAQARLVALAMDLGMAKEKLVDGDPHHATELVTEAHDEAKRALRELRDLVRGIHPAVLADRGLDAALSSLVSRCRVPVELSVNVPDRPRPVIESIAYFASSELLVNVSKHSQAGAAWLEVNVVRDTLVVRVRDDGIGGADPAKGTGLAGLAERVGSVDGRLTVDSPAGGPTVATVELPLRE